MEMNFILFNKNYGLKWNSLTFKNESGIHKCSRVTVEFINLKHNRGIHQNSRTKGKLIRIQIKSAIHKNSRTKWNL